MGADVQENFEEAFQQFAVPEDKKEEAKAEGPAAETPAEEPTAEEPVVEEPAAETPAEEPTAEEPVVEEPAVAPSADTAAQDDVLAKLAKVVADAGKDTKVEEKPEPKAEATEERPLYTDEESAFLESYDKDWADVAKGEALKRKAEYRELLQFVFGEVAKALQPMREVTDLLGERAHLIDVKESVPDYSDDLREQVIAWVATQPAYLQAAYNQVIQAGTVEEVKDLVDRYRGATGQKADTGSAAQKPTGKKDTELSSEAKKAAAALAPVESKRSGVQQPGDPEDFEDAWKLFAKDA